MTEFRCPLCGWRHEARSDDVVRMWHGVCPMSPDAPVAMQSRTGRHYDVYCGNFDCPTRAELLTFRVTEADLVDGEVWLCPRCRPVVAEVDVAKERL
jgi:hypothetical protein